jgi:signal recognition particle subunit SRP68
MTGYMHLENQQWQEALDKFAAARKIYEKMSQVSTTAEEEALCFSAIDSIDPNIRYCAYNLKLKGGQTMDISTLLEMRGGAEGGAGMDLLVAKMDELMAKRLHDKASTVHEVTWRGNTVPSKNSKLIEALLAAQESNAGLEEALKEGGKSSSVVSAEGVVDYMEADQLLEMYTKVIGAYWDATKLAEADLKEAQVCHVDTCCLSKHG